MQDARYKTENIKLQQIGAQPKALEYPQHVHSSPGSIHAWAVAPGINIISVDCQAAKGQFCLLSKQLKDSTAGKSLMMTNLPMPRAASRLPSAVQASFSAAAVG